MLITKSKGRIRVSYCSQHGTSWWTWRWGHELSCSYWKMVSYWRWSEHTSTSKSVSGCQLGEKICRLWSNIGESNRHRNHPGSSGTSRWTGNDHFVIPQHLSTYVFCYFVVQRWVNYDMHHTTRHRTTIYTVLRMFFLLYVSLHHFRIQYRCVVAVTESCLITMSCLSPGLKLK